MTATIDRAFGVGAGDSAVIPLAVEASIVADLLPKRLELAPVAGFERGTHPLLLVFHPT